MSELKSDKLQWELSIKDSEAQKTISDLNSSNRELEKSNKAIRVEMAKLEAQGKTMDDEYKQLKRTLELNNKTIKDNTDLIKSNEKEIGINNLTLQQLRKRYSELKKELDSTSQSLEPEKWAKLNAQVNESKDRIGELSGKQETAKKVSIDWASAIKTNVVGVLAGWGQKLLGLIGDHLSLERIINSTQKTGDEFAASMAGIGNQMDYVRRAINDLDFTNFRQNLKDAYDVAYNTAMILDELFERQNSFKIKDIKVQSQIEELQEQLRNVNLSDKERIDAANEIQRLTMQQAALQKNISADQVSAYKNLLMNQTKLNDKELEFIVENYNQNRDAINQARELISLEDKLQRAKVTYNNTAKSADASSRNLALSFLKKAQDDLDLYKSVNKEKIKGIEAVASVVNKYDQSTDDYVKNYVEAQTSFLNVEVEASRSLRRVITTRNALLKSMTDESIKRSKEVEKLTKEQQEKAFNDEIKSAEKASLQKQNILKQDYITGKISQEQYNILMESAAEELLLKKIEINQVYKKSTEELENQLLNNQLARLDKSKAELDKYAQKVKESFQKNLDYEVISTLSDINNILDDQTSQFEAAKDAAVKYFESKKTELDKQQELYDQDKLNLKNALDIKLLTQEQYEEAMNKLEEDNWQKRIQINAKGAVKIVETISSVLSQAAQAVSTLQEIEYSNLEAQKNKELSLAGNNADKRAEIEEKYEKKKLDIQKRYADVDMVIKISQALANGALAIMQAYATLPTPAAIAMTPVIAGLTAIQVAAIVAQRNAIKSQTYAGSTSSTAGAVRTVNADTGSSNTLSIAPAARQNSVNTSYDIDSLKSSKQSEDTKNAQEAASGLKELVKEIKRMRDIPNKTYVVLNELNAAQELRDKFKKEGSL